MTTAASSPPSNRALRHATGTAPPRDDLSVWRASAANRRYVIARAMVAHDRGQTGEARAGRDHRAVAPAARPAAKSAPAQRAWPRCAGRRWSLGGCGVRRLRRGSVCSCPGATPARNPGSDTGAAAPATPWDATPTAHAPARGSPCPEVCPGSRTPAPVIIGHYPALQHGSLGRDLLAGDFQPELVQPAQARQVRGSEGSVGHVEVFQMDSVRTSIIGRPRPPHPAATPATPATPSTAKSRGSPGLSRAGVRGGR